MNFPLRDVEPHIVRSVFEKMNTTTLYNATYHFRQKKDEIMLNQAYHVNAARLAAKTNNKERKTGSAVVYVSESSIRVSDHDITRQLICPLEHFKRHLPESEVKIHTLCFSLLKLLKIEELLINFPPSRFKPTRIKFHWSVRDKGDEEKAMFLLETYTAKSVEFLGTTGAHIMSNPRIHKVPRLIFSHSIRPTLEALLNFKGSQLYLANSVFSMDIAITLLEMPRTTARPLGSILFAMRVADMREILAVHRLRSYSLQCDFGSIENEKRWFCYIRTINEDFWEVHWEHYDSYTNRLPL